jgi:hypothetical protein
MARLQREMDQFISRFKNLALPCTKMRTIAAFICVIGFASVTMYGRAVKYWYPDELTDKSTFVCDGVVLDVTPHMPSLISNFRLYSAKVKVISVLKGAAVDMLELHYFVYEPWNPFMHIDDPFNVSLARGIKYRFYLDKDSNDATYFGCLQGQVDDAQSVEPILVPNGAEDARIRLSEVRQGWNKLEDLYEKAMLIGGKPGFNEARDSVVSEFLKLIMMCESLKKADTDQKQVKKTEDFYIQQLADWKDFLFPEPNETAIFDKLIVDDLPDKTIRAYVIQRMIMEWDHPNH